VRCAIDHDPHASQELTDPRTGLTYLAKGTGLYATATANRFVEGDPDFDSFDNLTFQPVTGNLYVIEDNPNGDIYACLPDGADRDIEADGCIKILSVNDSSAEPTGFLFFGDGKSAILSIQHFDDSNMALVDDYPTDDLLIIRNFKIEAQGQ
jgi:secreted PhoX family phosphatase